MAEGLYSKRSRAQFRGPTSSADENERIDNTFKDLSFLYNRMGVAEEKLVDYQRQAYKDVAALERAMSLLEERLATLEGGGVFFSLENQESTRFDNTEFEVSVGDRLTVDQKHGYITLPNIQSGSESRIRFRDSNGEFYLPSAFNAVAGGVLGSADDNTATVNESSIYNAFLNKPGRVWERNVVVDSVDPEGAMVTVYIGLPTSVAPSLRANFLTIDPFPARGVDIMGIAYSTDPNVNLNDTDSYTPMNELILYANEEASIGHSAPGAWPGDEILDSGPRAFYFDPKNITAIRVTLRTRNYFTENNKVIYTYGLSDLDVRSEKYLDEGRALFRFDAPAGETISEVSSVIPSIFNVTPLEAQEVFEYRVIWETSEDSGVYTLDPVPFSTKVWVEVTLRKTIGGGTPALASIDVDYS